MLQKIDLNSDLGEGFGRWTMGDDTNLLSLVSSANVACGGHAGDPETMFRTLRLAAQNGVAVGAHPGYNDKEGFGRRVIPMTPEEIGWMVAAQIGSLIAVATLVPVPVTYVKPHGALANIAARDPDVARAIVLAVQSVDSGLAILAISGTELEIATRSMGMTVYSEIYADRAYLESGQLVPRTEVGSVLHDPAEIADRLLQFATSGKMRTITGKSIELDAHSVCVHGDSEEALSIVSSLRDGFSACGIEISSFI